MLMLCAFIWGTAFVAQSAGSGMGAYSFLAGRSWLAVLVLLPTVRAFDALHRRHGAAYGWPKAPADRRHLLTAGLCCGTLLFAASAAQQIGITLNPSTAKAGFLTAMYVVLVPVFGLFLGRRGSARLWLSMVIAVGGLYLLCMKNGFGGIETSDWILLSCAVLFSFQIMTVDHFAPQVDGVRLSLLQFFVVAVESTAAALLFENPTLAEFGANWLPLAYCGVMSSGVAYTLQILGQRDVNPAIASLIMCLESATGMVASTRSSDAYVYWMPRFPIRACLARIFNWSSGTSVGRISARIVRSTATATPSSSLVSVVLSTQAFTESSAFPIAIPTPASCNMVTSQTPSPIAITSSGDTDSLVISTPKVFPLSMNWGTTSKK